MNTMVTVKIITRTIMLNHMIIQKSIVETVRIADILVTIFTHVIVMKRMHTNLRLAQSPHGLKTFFRDKYRAVFQDVSF